MAIKIEFDSSHNVIEPTMVLAQKSGKLLGSIQCHKIKLKESLNSPADFYFEVYKADYANNSSLWDNIEDFKIVWVKEWNKCYEIYVETTDESGIRKSVTAKSLGEAELSQINLYGIEINTENDIARDNYAPTILYNPQNTSVSLLHRISNKIPHYTINHVDNSISNIQRTFSFDNKSIYDAFQEIAEEIHCLFDISCHYVNGVLTRQISVYDLDSYCPVCEERGSFITACSKCGNTSGIIKGYGNDTGIFIDTENLANTITYKVENESVKNCFKLEAGDDLMTATVINGNPNGSSYIWYIPQKIKNDMSTVLVQKLDDYGDLYEYYLDEYNATIPADIITSYNQLVTKYSTYNQDLQSITYPIVGFSKIIEAYYNTIDLYLFLKSGLMPTVAVASTNATTEITKLTSNALSPVSVQDLSVCSLSSAESAVLSVAKTIIDHRYKIDITTSSYENNTWQGNFTITNYSDDEDTATSGNITIIVNDDYEKFTKQKIDKILSKSVANGEPADIADLFALSNQNFVLEIKKYCLARLRSFHDCCQSCLDVLIQQGIADKSLWANRVSDLYTTIYLPYYNKLHLLEAEIQLRESEIALITGTYDSDGNIENNGVQTLIEKERAKIQQALNFENYLGQTLWLEFATFRREDTYKNDNYISDGLNNAELFEKALQFMETAKKDIVKSATLQHTITATLKNLLVMPEFEPLLNQFEVGNWLRAKIDGQIYKLRLLDYEIDFDSLEILNVTFSDVVYGDNEVSDVESVINQAKSISTSYGAVTRQMEQGKKTTGIVNDWKENGLNVNNTKIVCQADNQSYTSDEHGMLFRKYDPINESYDNKQLKITNSTLAITDDNWETVKSAVGYYYYFDPTTNKLVEGYGVNAETIVGKLILGEQLGIYNNSGSMMFDDDGLTITNNVNTFTVNPNNNSLVTLSKTVNNSTENIFYVDTNGVLHLKGDGSDLDMSNNGTVRYAWNNSSQEIKFEVTNQGRAEINFYATSENRRLSCLANDGITFYRNDANNAVRLRLNYNGLYGYNNSAYRTFILNDDGLIFYSGTNANEEQKIIISKDYLSFYTVLNNTNTLIGNLGVGTYSNQSGQDTGVSLYSSRGASASLIGSTVRLASYDSFGNVHNYILISSNGIDCLANLDMNNNSILNNSDIRLKTNIQDTNVNALELINQIEMKSFDWIDSNKHEQIGMIAQQLQEIIPNVVYESPDDSKLSIKPLEFIPYLIKAIQELSANQN